MKKSIPMNILYIFIGSLLYAISVNSFTLANNLGEGGVTGISLILYYLSNFPPGVTIFLINVVILTIGYKYLDRETIAYTIVANVFISVLLEVVHVGTFIPENSLLAPIGAGVFMGVALGIIMRGEGTTAGSDIIAQMMRKYLGMNLSVALLLIDVIVVLSGSFLIGAENTFLTLVNLFVQSRVLDFVLEGLNPKKSVFIISPKYKEIAKEIEKQIGRGMTVLYGEGHYTQERKNILYIIINRQQILPIKRIIESVDDRAFVTISDVQEVSGEGFTYLPPEDQANIRDQKNREWREMKKEKQSLKNQTQ